MARAVILHYHLFKNAGTSVDRLLQESFPGQWREREFDRKASDVPARVEDWVAMERDAVAFSSHTAVMPLPALRGTDVLPIVFIREPLVRLHSAYTFERSQPGDHYGPSIARMTDFAGYLRARLDRPHDRSARNFHAARLARMFPEASGTLEERAWRAVDALPVVGLVEAFAPSMREYALAAARLGLTLKIRDIRENASGPARVSDAERARDLRDSVPDALLGEFDAHNAVDYAIYKERRSWYRGDDAPGPMP